MKAFHMDGDSIRLFFANFENRPDDEEFEEIMSILKKNDCVIEEKLMGPDCNIVQCTAESEKFDVIR